VVAADFPDAGHRDMILALCIMVAYADGDYSAAERTAVLAAAASLGASGERVEQILAQVKDYMLAQLAHLPDAASVAVVAKELG
jgi:DnaJ-domain-containing protein 1